MQEASSAESASTAAEQAAAAAVVANQKAIEAVPVAQAAQKSAADALAAVQAELETAKSYAKAQEQPVRTLVYSPDQKTLACGGDNKLVRTWSADIGVPLDTYASQSAAISALAFTPDGTLVSAADKTATAWNSDADWTLERTIGNVDNSSILDDRVLSLAFSPDGKLLASGGGEPTRSGELKLWNVADGKLVRAVSPSHSDTVFCVEFSPEGNSIASAGADRMMKVFDASSGALQRTYEGHTHHVLGVSWRGDGKLLASCGADNAVKMWDVATGEQPRPAHATPKEATAIRFVPLTTKVLVACGDKTLRLFETNVGGGQDRAYSGAADYLYSLSVSRDGKTVIAGGQDSTLRLWNVDNGQIIREFPAPPADGATVAKQ
jgi:WD40 repeat protein